MPVTRWHAELAVLGSTVAADVLLEVAGDRLVAVTPGVPAPAAALRLPGLTLPGLANAHSHAFHRALRGRTAGGGGDFWTWREQMYAVAAGLDPDSYYRLARATYAEMALAGITVVGEFHYLHHAAEGHRYAERNAMGTALLAAAADAGVRITLLDAIYLQADVTGGPLSGVQLRFGDRDVAGWADRVAELPAGTATARVGAAIHSVRAVDPASMAAVADWAAQRAAPLHLHLSEQPRENADTLAVYGASPTQLVAAAGVLGPASTAVHATHLSDGDVGRLGAAGTSVCLCPTTERDLADGVGPGARLAAAGSPLCLGSDSNAVIDLFEEARAVELDERLVTGRRGMHRPADLLRAATRGGAAALGWPDAGELAVGRLADFATVRLNSPRLAGLDRGQAVAAVLFAATAADIASVVVGGRPVVTDGRHLGVGDVAAALAAAVPAAWERR